MVKKPKSPEYVLEVYESDFPEAEGKLMACIVKKGAPVGHDNLLVYYGDSLAKIRARAKKSGYKITEVKILVS